MLVMDRRKSIIHIQNVFLISPIPIYIIRETERYLIGYEPKKYREHRLLYKIDKNLVNEPQFGVVNEVKIDVPIDVNAREDFRNTIKKSDPQWHIKSKNIAVRIIPTRYAELSPLYGTFYYFEWRHTSKGGADELEFSIPECPIITNSSTISDVCYKKINSQVSGSGTHALQTYLVISRNRGTYKIGNWIKTSNETLHTYIYPVTVIF
jgi:hypothetical protein